MTLFEGNYAPVITQLQGSLHSKNELDLLHHFDADHECDGQTKAQTDRQNSRIAYIALICNASCGENNKS